MLTQDFVKVKTLLALCEEQKYRVARPVIAIDATKARQIIAAWNDVPQVGERELGEEHAVLEDLKQASASLSRIVAWLGDDEHLLLRWVQRLYETVESRYAASIVRLVLGLPEDEEPECDAETATGSAG